MITDTASQRPLELTRSEMRILERIRTASRLRKINVWVLGLGSMAFLSIGVLYIIILVKGLHEHGIPASNLFTVLSESDHSSGIDVLFVFVGASVIPLMLWVALQLAFSAIFLGQITRQHQLLLKLADEQERNLEEQSAVNERT